MSFARWLPQQGAMVLLDEVLTHDAGHIVCRTRSHRDAGNPLRVDGQLPVWAGIEYAAQAMAAHFTLSRGVEGTGTVGLLGALRNVVTAAARLDDIDAALIVEARRLSYDAAGSIYAFVVTEEAAGRELLRGRATVVQATGAAR